LIYFLLGLPVFSTIFNHFDLNFGLSADFSIQL